MACKICHRPKLREYTTALLLRIAGKPFTLERIEKIAAGADRTPENFASDLEALPALLADHPVGKWPATVGLAAARDYLMGAKS